MFVCVSVWCEFWYKWGWPKHFSAFSLALNELQLFRISANLKHLHNLNYAPLFQPINRDWDVWCMHPLSLLVKMNSLPCLLSLFQILALVFSENVLSKLLNRSIISLILHKKRSRLRYRGCAADVSRSRDTRDSSLLDGKTTSLTWNMTRSYCSFSLYYLEKKEQNQGNLVHIGVPTDKEEKMASHLITSLKTEKGEQDGWQPTTGRISSNNIINSFLCSNCCCCCWDFFKLRYIDCLWH